MIRILLGSVVLLRFLQQGEVGVGVFLLPPPLWEGGVGGFFSSFISCCSGCLQHSFYEVLIINT